MDKLVRADEKAPDGTGFNAEPLFFREISEKEFSQSQFHNYRPKFMEYRQIIPKSQMIDGKFVAGRMIQANLFWFADDTGIAISSNFDGKVRYFAFGCKHKLGVDHYEAGKSYSCVNCKSEISEPWMQSLAEDSGWSLSKSSRPMYGIRDYERTMKFARTLTDNELDSLTKFLGKVDCPGYTGILSKWNGTTRSYTFQTTYDSSD